MPHSRKNKSRHGDNRKNLGGAAWFTANVRKQRRKEQMAKASRRKNRGK